MSLSLTRREPSTIDPSAVKPCAFLSAADASATSCFGDLKSPERDGEAFDADDVDDPV